MVPAVTVRLLLLFSIFTFSRAQDGTEQCLLAKTYPPLHRYHYAYEGQSLNSLNGAVNGPRVACKVELEVPDPCRYVLHTLDCSLTQVTGVDNKGNPEFGAASLSAEEFKTSMSRHPLKFSVEGRHDVKLFPEKDERINVLNIKRGIVSALAVPVHEEKIDSRMPTIYGLCETDWTVNSRQDVATNVTLHRNLNRCDQFRLGKDHTSPLALITGLRHPLARLIRSSQTCTYQFDHEKRHMTFGTCTDKHVLLPFSNGDHGVTSVGKQILNLIEVSENHNRVFDHYQPHATALHVDRIVDMSPIQDKEAALAVLRDLHHLSQSREGRKRAGLAHKLVSVIRRMNAQTLTAAVSEALEISRPLTYQALLQCGTPECSSAVMQMFQSFDTPSFEVDASVYAMGMISHPSRVLLEEMLRFAKTKPSKAIYYALSNSVRRLYEAEGVTPEIQAVSEHVLQQIGDCRGDQDRLFLLLRASGNMAAALGSSHPGWNSAIIQCISHPMVSSEAQQAAVQIYRQITVPKEGREVLMQVVLDSTASVQKRVAAFLVLMKNPHPAELSQMAAALRLEKNPQAKSFYMSYVSHVLSSTAPETFELRQMIRDAFEDNEVGTVVDPFKFSKYYSLGSLEGNMIFEAPDTLPKEVMLKTTLNAFGFDMDMIEIGIDGQGFEPFVDALFGDNGFFPNTVLKTILFASDKLHPIMTNERKKRQAPTSFVREFRDKISRVLEDLKSHDAPEAMVYLRLMGAELGYLKTEDVEDFVKSVAGTIDVLFKEIPREFVKSLFSGADSELFLHYIFMDNEYYLPTGPGFPLKLALSGTFTPGIKGGMKFSKDWKELAVTPSAGIEFVTEVGAHLPDYVDSGVEMHTSVYHESDFRVKLSLTSKKMTIVIPAPREATEILSVTNSLVSVGNGQTVSIPGLGTSSAAKKCFEPVPGLKFCSILQYFDATSKLKSALFPLTGDSKVAVELHPAEGFTGFTASVEYDCADGVHKVTTGVKAEGTAIEATHTVLFNRQTHTVSSELLIPPLQFVSEVSAKVTLEEPMALELKSDLSLPDTSSRHTLTLTCDSEEIKVALKSGTSFEDTPSVQAVDAFVNSVIQRVGRIESKIRGIMDDSVGESVTHLPVTLSPERLFFNVDATAKYQFGQGYYTISLPPDRISTGYFDGLKEIHISRLTIPQLDLDFGPIHIPLPTIVLPETVSLPVFGFAGASGKLSSNFYNLEVAGSAGEDPAKRSSYSAKVKVLGSSPVDLFSFAAEGSASVAETSDESLQACVRTTVSHRFINVSVQVEETLNFAEQINLKSSSKFEVNSPLGLGIVMKHRGQFESNEEGMTGNRQLEVVFQAGTAQASGELTQLVSFLPFRPEPKVTLSLTINSKYFQADNTIEATVADRRLSVLSTTSAFKDKLKNTAEITFSKSERALKSDTSVSMSSIKIQNKAEVISTARGVHMKVTTRSGLSGERLQSSLTGELSSTGLRLHSDASGKFLSHKIDQNSVLTLDKDGLSSSGTTKLQSLLNLEGLTLSFQTNYSSLALSSVCTSQGTIIGAQLNHKTHTEIDGLVGSFKNELSLKRDDFQLDSLIQAAVAPFQLHLESRSDASGEVYLEHRHSGQMSTKFLLKAQPLSFAHIQEYGISTSHYVERYRSIETKLNSSFDLLLLPSKQQTSVSTKAKVSNHAVSQEIRAYNTPQRLGLEGTFSADLFSGDADNQEFSYSGSIKYNKNESSHVTLPLLESLENIRMSAVSLAETVKHCINRLEVNSPIVPRLVSSMMSSLNLEIRAEQLKQLLTSLIRERSSLLEHLENFLTELVSTVEQFIQVMASCIRDVMEILESQLDDSNGVFETVKNLAGSIDVQQMSTVSSVKWLFAELKSSRLDAGLEYLRLLLLKHKIDGIIEDVLDVFVQQIEKLKLDEAATGLAVPLKSLQVFVSRLLEDVIASLRSRRFSAFHHLRENSVFSTPEFIEHQNISSKTPGFPGTTLAFLLPPFTSIHSSVNISSPFYSVRTTAEITNSSKTHHLYDITLKSKGASVPFIPAYSYDLSSTVRVAVPADTRLVVSEKATFTMKDLSLTQQTVLTLNASSSNGLDDGVRFSLGTSYNHQLTDPSYALSSEVTLDHNAVLIQDSSAITVRVRNDGKGGLVLKGFSDQAVHRSQLDLTSDLSGLTMTLAGRTDSDLLKMAMKAGADGVLPRLLQFNAEVKSESPYIKNSLLVASGEAQIDDLTLQLKVVHETELQQFASGVLTNTVNVTVCPGEAAVESQNRANVVFFANMLTEMWESQNDFALLLDAEVQHVNLVSKSESSWHKFSSNFTAGNSRADVGLYTHLSLDVNLPTAFLPGGLVLVPHDGVVLDAKLVYQKIAPTLNPMEDVDLLVIPAFGNLLFDVFCRCPDFELKASAGVFLMNECAMRVAARTVSEHKSVQGKLDGSISLATDEGWRLASTLCLENRHVTGSHNATFTLGNVYEGRFSADTTAMVNVKNVLLNGTHQLTADTRARPKMASALKATYKFNLTEEDASGHGDAENSFQMDATRSSISMLSLSKGDFDGSFWKDHFLRVTANNDFAAHVASEGLRSSMNTTGKGVVYFNTEWMKFTTDERVTLHGDLARVQSLRELDMDVYIKDRSENRTMNITSLVETDFAPIGTIIAATEMMLSQPSYDDFTGETDWNRYPHNGFKSKVFSRWFNVSVDVFAEAVGDFGNINCTLNLTSPSALMKYEMDFHSERDYK